MRYNKNIEKGDEASCFHLWILAGFPDMQDIKPSLRKGMLVPLKILAAKTEVTTGGFEGHNTVEFNRNLTCYDFLVYL